MAKGTQDAQNLRAPVPPAETGCARALEDVPQDTLAQGTPLACRQPVPEAQHHSSPMDLHRQFVQLSVEQAQGGDLCPGHTLEECGLLLDGRVLTCPL